MTLEEINKKNGERLLDRIAEAYKNNEIVITYEKGYFGFKIDMVRVDMFSNAYYFNFASAYSIPLYDAKKEHADLHKELLENAKDSDIEGQIAAAEARIKELKAKLQK